MNEKGDGWYFVRVYDKSNNLIDSLDFHFVRDLINISLPSKSPLPNPNGHESTRVEITHDPKASIFPASALAEKLELECSPGRTILVVPPDQSADRTLWTIGSFREMPFPILVERAWWALGNEDENPNRWIDRPIATKRSAFNATSKSAVWIRLPAKRYAKHLFLGFNREHVIPIDQKADEEIVCMPLRGFTDCEEIGILHEEQTLKCWVEDLPHFATMLILEIPLLHCKFCEFESRNGAELTAHTVEHHVVNLLGNFEEITDYEAIKLFDKTLPYKIYKCAYCNRYVRHDVLGSPTSRITTHIETGCPIGSGMRTTGKIRFSIINEANEIREHLIRNLPRILECQLCQDRFKNPVNQTLIDHLASNHKTSFYEQGNEAYL